MNHEKEKRLAMQTAYVRGAGYGYATAMQAFNTLTDMPVNELAERAARSAAEIYPVMNKRPRVVELREWSYRFVNGHTEAKRYDGDWVTARAFPRREDLLLLGAIAEGYEHAPTQAHEALLSTGYRFRIQDGKVHVHPPDEKCWVESWFTSPQLMDLGQLGVKPEEEVVI